MRVQLLLSENISASLRWVIEVSMCRDALYRGLSTSQEKDTIAVIKQAAAILA